MARDLSPEISIFSNLNPSPGIPTLWNANYNPGSCSGQSPEPTLGNLTIWNPNHSHGNLIGPALNLAWGAHSTLTLMEPCLFFILTLAQGSLPFITLDQGAQMAPFLTLAGE